MAKFTLNGYDSYSGCDVLVTARINALYDTPKALKEKVYVLSSLQTISISTHQDRRPVRVIGSVNALDYVMSPRTIAGSLVFAVFDKHFATEMFNDLKESTGRDFRMPDELPALDLTLTFSNEYGRESRMAIYGVKIINEGQVMSVNDLYTENTYQFVATAMEPLRRDDNSNSSINADIVPQVVSSNDYSINQDLVSGEVLFDKDNITIDSISRISLIASVEQPTIYNQDGIVILYLSPVQSVGYITIYDKKKDKIVSEISVNHKSRQYSVYLSAGDYSAWYHNNNKVLSNTVYFTINEVFNSVSSYNDAPIIDNVTHNSIIAVSNNPTHTTGVCIDLTTMEQYESEINSRTFKFTDLDSNKRYNIYTKNDNSISKSITTKTLDAEHTTLNIYKDYVKNNKKLLAKSFDNYESILNSLTDDNFLYALAKHNSIEAKELIYMAIKYKNEFTTIINSDYENMATKKIDSVYGNTFEFKTGVAKANIFLNKNKKDYFEHSEVYPSEITYTGKSNSLYNVVSINDNYIKSPKYTFYIYNDNDKAIIQQQFGAVNVLNTLEPIKIINSKLSNDSLLCLTAKNYKTKDINLLKAPSGHINDNYDLVLNLDYRDIVGERDNVYYLCICKLEECLDRTTFRKIKTRLNSSSVIFTNILTAINKNDIYSIWIEDDQYNTISDLGFVTYTNLIEDLNSSIIEYECESIIKKLQNNLNKPNYLYDMLISINYEDITEKDIYKELAQTFLTIKEAYAYDLIFELFKIKFAYIYIFDNKYRKATYNKITKIVEFKNTTDIELVHIAIKKDDYTVNIINDNKTVINGSYDINIFYLISSNPVVKSGFVIIDNNDRADSYLIDLEVI